MNSANVQPTKVWIKAVDPKSGRTYYANTVTRKTQWDVPEGWIEGGFPPVLPPEDNSDDDELPAKWEAMHDPTTGKPFYVNHELKITQWNRPRETKLASKISRSSADSTTSSAAMARILQASMPNNISQPRSYFQEASYFQPAQSGAAGEVDLSDSMPALDFTVKKVADKYRLECPHCSALFTLSKRRHHCRLCGDVFCDTCSNHRVSLPLEGSEFEKPVRICDLCNRDVEQGNFFSMRRYLTPLTLFDPENPDEDEESGVATARNVNAALAALTLDLDQIVQNAEGFEEKVTIPPNILVPNIIKHLSSRSDTSERAIRALASLLSLGSMVGKSDFAHAIYLHGKKKTLDQILAILERSSSDRRTLFVQEKAAQTIFYLTETHIMTSFANKRDELRLSFEGSGDIESGDVRALDIQRCLRNMIDHSSTTKNPNLQRWSTASVRNLVMEDHRLTCLAINEVAERVASGEPASAPDYESFLGNLVSSGGIMILCSLIGAEDSDTRAHATGALGAILTATRAIDSATSALSEMTGGDAGHYQRYDGDIIRAITAGSGFGSSVSQLLLSADNGVASMGCGFLASLVIPIITNPEGSSTLPSKYDCRNDLDGVGACREAALEIAGGGCLPALLSLVRENGRLIRPMELRSMAMETFAAVATAVGEIGRAWAGGKYEEQMEINNAPMALTRAVTAFNDEQVIDVALEVLKASSVQSLGSQRDTPAARIREAAGIILGAITSCSAEAIMELHSRQVLSSLILTANDSTMTAPSTFRGDNAPRCLGMLEAASSILMFSWQHPSGASSELLDRLIESLDVGVVTFLYQTLTFKMDWDSRDKSAGGMKARASGCRLACCLFGIALADETSIGMRRLMESCDLDQTSRRVTRGPRNILEAVLTALQTSLTHAHKVLTGGISRSLQHHAALFDLVEASLLATGSMCGSSVAPGGTEGTMISGDRFLVARVDEFESRRREICKVACDVVIRGTQSGPALLPTMLIGGFGEGAVDASLRLALAIAQNGSKDQHSKLASSGILVPVSDILKAALSSGDLYRFSAALALVRFCGPHVASGTCGGIQSVRDAIRIATKVLILPADPGASSEQTKVQESLKAECVRAIESLSKNASLWSAISKDALPSIISYLNNIMGHSWTSFSRSDTGAAALRAVLEIVQVPSHAVFAAECGLADSLGKLLGRGGLLFDQSEKEARSLAMQILRVLVSRAESRRHCNMLRSETLGSVCSAIGATAKQLSDSDFTQLSDFIFSAIEIVHFVVGDIQSLGDTADILHSREAELFVECVGGETHFIRALCASLLAYKTGMTIKRHDVDGHDDELPIPSTYGRSLHGVAGPCAGYHNLHEAAASLLFTAASFACVVDSKKSESFWNSFLAKDLAKDLNKGEDDTNVRRASLTLVSLFLSLVSSGYFLPSEKGKQADTENLLFPLFRYRLLEAVRDILHEERRLSQSNNIEEFMLQILVSFEIPRICVSVSKDPAILDLAYHLLTMLVDEEPDEIMQSFVDNKDSMMSLFDLLNLEFVPQPTSQATDIRRLLSTALNTLASSGALADAVAKFDVRSSAIDALAAACLAEKENSEDDEEELTSSRLSTGLMKCLVDLCTVQFDDGRKEFQLTSSDAVSIANKLGKKICEMVISRFLERARMQRYEIGDGENVMDAPDVAMLCAIAHHEKALQILRSIGGFHALSQVAGEGELSAIEALAKGCKDEPTLLLEADTYQSIISLFSVYDHRSHPSIQPSLNDQVECAAFHLLAQLCNSSSKGRQAVTVASGFIHCFDRALDLVSSLCPTKPESDGESKGGEVESDIVDFSDAIHDQPLKTRPNGESCPLSLVEAAFTILSSIILSIQIQESLICDDTFIQACFYSARRGSTSVLRRSAVRVIARLAHCTSSGSRLTAPDAAKVLCEMLTDYSTATSGSDFTYAGDNAATLAADGLICVFGKLASEQKQITISEIGKVYFDVLRNRSLSKTVSDQLGSGKLAYSLTRLMLVGMGSESVEAAFGSSIILPMVGTLQWRYDSKTILQEDEQVYWDASATHALQILSLWLEQGKSLRTYGTSSFESHNIQDNIWMVARPGKAPRKAVDFAVAVTLASKSADASARLHAERIYTWLNES